MFGVFEAGYTRGVKIFIASDHAGFELKNALGEWLRGQGHEVVDCGPATLNPQDDYPDFIAPLAKRVVAEPGTFGIAMGGSGEGEAMVANRVPGARAAGFYGGSLEVVRLARQHNDANILSLGARLVSGEEALAAVELFLATPFSNEERHERRIEKLG